MDYDGETFTINTTDTFLYDLLKMEENVKDLTNAFKHLNVHKFEINKKEKLVTKMQQDIKKLKEMFGEKLTIE